MVGRDEYPGYKRGVRELRPLLGTVKRKYYICQNKLMNNLAALHIAKLCYGHLQYVCLR